jgi:hypothetical protein
MADVDFKALEELYGGQELVNAVKETEAGGGDFVEVPHGSYEVSVANIEFGTTKAGAPKVAFRFKIEDGTYKGQSIFAHMVIGKPYGIHKCNELLKSLDTGIPIEFSGFAQYAELVMDVHEKVEELGNTYELEFNEVKNFPTYEIVGVFEDASI